MFGYNKNPTNTPLHLAVRKGDIEIVKTILDKGGMIDATNDDGRTPLHDAISCKNMKVTSLLLKHKANVNIRDKDGVSPLHVAVQVGCLQIVEELLELGALVNCVCTSRWGKGYAPLHFAVEEGNKEIIKLLLSRGANVNVQGEDGISPLHVAAKKGFIHIAKYLLNHGACPYSLTFKEEYTPLHFASRQGSRETVKLFLDRGADINASTINNFSPLQFAIKYGHITVVEQLLKHGAKVDDQDEDGKTTLLLAVEKGNPLIVEEVLKYFPDINNQSNRSSLKTAVRSLHNGSFYYCKRIVEALLEYGFTIYPEDANNPELLHSAVEQGYLKIVEDLLKHGADVNMLHFSIFKRDFTPLHSAVKNKQEEVVKLLISYGADINAQEVNGNSPIFYAVKNADLKITKLLLANRADVNNPELLNISVKNEYREIVEVLLQHDADINARDNYGRTALHFTALCECIIGPLTIVNHDIKGEIAKLLLSKGANVDAQTKTGATTLHAATEKGYAKVVETLLEYNTNVNSRVKSHSKPIHPSAQKKAKLQKGNEEISTILFHKGGANVNIKQKDGMTALHLGAQKGYLDIIKTLLKFGADVNSRDEAGRTALHVASQKGNVDVVATLLAYGSNINILSKNNRTPFDFALRGKMTLASERHNYGSGNVNSDSYGIASSEMTIEVLTRHVVKLKSANLYVSNDNLLSINRTINLSYYQHECEKEIESMTSEKIDNANVSFYDILAKGANSLAVYMRNENIVQVLKSGDYKRKYPIYASMIKIHFKKGRERKELFEQGNKIFPFLFHNFPKLPIDCSEKIFSYLSNEDLKNLITFS